MKKSAQNGKLMTSLERFDRSVGRTLVTSDEALGYCQTEESRKEERQKGRGGCEEKETLKHLSKSTRRALGKEGAKAAKAAKR
jgi:hypothetical protein